MKTRFAWLVVVVSVFGLAGCLPKEKVVWSPDGQAAAVLGEDGLFFCDADGRIVAKSDLKTMCLAWFPDGKHLAVVSVRSAKWDEIASLMGPARRERTIALAEALYKQIMDYSGDWDEFKPAIGDDNELIYNIEYIRRQHPKELAAKLGGKMKEVAEMPVYVYDLTVYEWNGKLGKAPKPLATSLDCIHNIQVNPAGAALAYTTVVQYVSEQTDGRIESHALFVAAVAGGAEPAKLADISGSRPAWLDNSRLAYGVSAAGGAGLLSVATVCDKDGNLLPDVKARNVPITNELAIVYDSNFSVQALDSNRMVFASTPMPGKPDETGMLLYVYDIKSGKLSSVDEVMTEHMQRFSLSPGRTKVAIGADNITIVDVLDSKAPTVEIVNKTDGGGTNIMVLPAWRTSEELTFVVPAGSAWGSPDREELVVWSLKKGAVNPVRVLSKDWPDELAKGVLASKQAASQPASGPATQSATTTATQP